MLRVEIPRDGAKPYKTYLLEKKIPLTINNAGRDKRNANLYNIVIPENFKPTDPFVIVLELDNITQSTDSYQQAKI